MAKASTKGMKKMMPGGSQAPMLSINSDQFPEIKDWKVGETYELAVEVKMTSKHEGQEYTFDKANAGLVRASFDIKSVQTDEEEDASDADGK